MSAEKYAAGNQFAESGDSLFKTFSIASRVPRPGWPVWPNLAVRQITAQYGETRAGKGFCQSHQ
jgi:hypothetical protein